MLPLAKNLSHSLKDIAHPLTLAKVRLKLDLASREEGGQVTAPIGTQCRPKNSDNQSQHCASKSLHFKSSTKGGRSSTLPLKETRRFKGGLVKV